MFNKKKIRTCYFCKETSIFFLYCPLCFRNWEGPTRYESFLERHIPPYEGWHRIKLITALKKDGYKLNYWKLKKIRGITTAVDKWF